MLAFNPEDEQILARARDHDKWVGRERERAPISVIFIDSAVSTSLTNRKCTCGKPLRTGPAVRVYYVIGDICVHVECLKTMLGSLGTEPDRLAMLVADRFSA